MGVPFIVAPTEAEAQCAVLAKAGKVYAAASEDMDTLTFASPVLLRHLTFRRAEEGAYPGNSSRPSVGGIGDGHGPGMLGRPVAYLN